MALYEPAQHFVLMRDYGYEGGLVLALYVAVHALLHGLSRSRACALRLSDRSARRRSAIRTPRSVALGLAACVARERREPHGRRCSPGAARTSTDHHFIMWLGIGHCLHGWSRLAQGDIAGGADEIRFGLAIWEATGAKVPGTYLRLTLIEAELARGDPERRTGRRRAGLHQCRTTLESLPGT